MKDTPEHIRKLQLEIWLSKPPMERLRQALEDNAALYQFSKALGKNNQNLLSDNQPPKHF